MSTRAFWAKAAAAVVAFVVLIGAVVYATQRIWITELVGVMVSLGFAGAYALGSFVVALISERADPWVRRW